MIVEKKRIEWIDIVKGIGIIMVLIGHRETTPGIYYYIFSFHMALFFIMAGYTFSESKYQNVISFAINRAKRLLIPFFIFNLISLVVVWVQLNYPEVTNNRSLPFYDANIPNLKRTLFDQFFALHGDAIWNVALWFLPCLFATEVLFFLSVRLIKKLMMRYEFFKFNSTLMAILVIFSLIGYQINAHWIFSSNLVFTTVVFMGLGYLFKQSNSQIIKNSNSLLLMISLITVGVFVGYYINVKYSLNLTMAINANVWRYIGGYIAAMCSTGGIIILSVLIGRQSILSFLGRNSLFILSTHLIIFWVLQTLENIFDLQLYNHQPTILISICYCLACLLISYPLIKFCNRYVPFIVGNTRSKN